ncbi:MAG: DnaJ C-terminal domain-containing protein, partial [Oscillospiraceae bacterium]
VTIQQLVQCKTCGGSGAASGSSPTTCPECNGTGQVTVQQRTPFGIVQTVRPCSSCGGKGKIIKDPCKDCRGKGRVRTSKKMEVTIPAGIDNGQTFALRGQGDNGMNGGPAGDLNITVSVRQDELFERDGYDVWCDVPVTYTQAALGDEITVPTIDGKVSYSVPEGTQPYTVFRLKNKGIPYVNGKGRGDQYVRAMVEVPKNLSEKQKELLKSFEKTLTDKHYNKRKSFFDKLKDRMN